MTLANLSFVAGLPGVKSAVLSDRRGNFVEALGEGNAEEVAAISGFVTSVLGLLGKELNLGGLTRFSFSGKAQACLVAVFADAALSIAIEPPSALSSVEKAIDSEPQG